MSEIQYTCPECDGKFETDDVSCGFAGVCPLCGEWIELDHPRKDEVTGTFKSKGHIGPEPVKYFQALESKDVAQLHSGQADPYPSIERFFLDGELISHVSEHFLCSDQSCPCPGTERLVPGKTGFLYISETVVKFRTDALTLEECRSKVRVEKERLHAYGAVYRVFSSGILNPILLCREGAERRGLDLGIAGEDAKYVFKTGWCPLRPTPKQKTDHS